MATLKPPLVIMEAALLIIFLRAIESAAAVTDGYCAGNRIPNENGHCVTAITLAECDANVEQWKFKTEDCKEELKEAKMVDSNPCPTCNTPNTTSSTGIPLITMENTNCNPGQDLVWIVILVIVIIVLLVANVCQWMHYRHKKSAKNIISHHCDIESTTPLVHIGNGSVRAEPDAGPFEDSDSRRDHDDMRDKRSKRPAAAANGNVVADPLKKVKVSNVGQRRMDEALRIIETSVTGIDDADGIMRHVLNFTAIECVTITNANNSKPIPTLRAAYKKWIEDNSHEANIANLVASLRKAKKNSMADEICRLPKEDRSGNTLGERVANDPFKIAIRICEENLNADQAIHFFQHQLQLVQEMNIPLLDNKTLVREGLKTWKRNMKENATVEKLIQLLEDAGFRHCAALICDHLKLPRNDPHFNSLAPACVRTFAIEPAQADIKAGPFQTEKNGEFSGNSRTPEEGPSVESQSGASHPTSDDVHIERETSSNTFGAAGGEVWEEHQEDSEQMQEIDAYASDPRSDGKSANLRE